MERGREAGGGREKWAIGVRRRSAALAGDHPSTRQELRQTDRPKERTAEHLPPPLLPLSALSPPAHRISGCIAPIFAHARSLAQQAIPDRIRSALSLTVSLELRGYVNCGGDITVAERATAIENEGSKASSELPWISRRPRGKEDASSLKLGKTPFPTPRICGAERHCRRRERTQVR